MDSRNIYGKVLVVKGIQSGEDGKVPEHKLDVPEDRLDTSKKAEIQTVTNTDRPPKKLDLIVKDYSEIFVPVKGKPKPSIPRKSQSKAPS